MSCPRRESGFADHRERMASSTGSIRSGSRMPEGSTALGLVATPRGQVQSAVTGGRQLLDVLTGLVRRFDGQLDRSEPGAPIDAVLHLVGRDVSAASESRGQNVFDGAL